MLSIHKKSLPIYAAYFYPFLTQQDHSIDSAILDAFRLNAESTVNIFQCVNYILKPS